MLTCTEVRLLSIFYFYVFYISCMHVAECISFAHVGVYIFIYAGGNHAAFYVEINIIMEFGCFLHPVLC